MEKNASRLRAPSVLVLLAMGIFACDESPTSPDLLFPVDLSQPWAEASPSSQGFRSGEIQSAIEVAEGIPRLLSLLVVRNGALVVEEYFRGNHADSLNDLRSVTKSVVSTLTGLAIQAGYLAGVHETLGDLIPDAPFQHPEQRDITVRHLLTMSGGFDWYEQGAIGYNDWIRSEDRIAYLLGKPIVDEPGTRFSYNSAAVHLLGVVLEAVSGMSLPELADELLFHPIGIARSRWEPLPPHHNGGAGLDLRPRDLARLGQLFLQEGRSGYQPILAEPWILQATQPVFTWRGSFGALRGLSYGFLWWTEDGEYGPAFLAWGYGGQFLFVVPNLELVVVVTTEWRGVSQDEGADAVEEAVLDVIVNRILPAAR